MNCAIAVAGHAIWFYTLVLSIEMTSTAHCLLLHVSCVVLVVIINIFRRIILHRWEYIGIFLSVIGGALVILNEEESERNLNEEKIILTY